MKKIIAFTLFLTIFVTSFSGCSFLRKISVTGTEAAKILLANERLDENTAGQKVNIFSSIGDILPISATDTPEMTTLTAYGNGEFLNLKNADGADVGSDHVRIGCKGEPQSIITDKWIEGIHWGEKLMLRVGESSETVITFSEREGYYEIGRRYTDKLGRNIYEMYNVYDYGTVYSMCIPGEHYEYMYEHVDGFSDFFVADHARGYWSINRFGAYVDDMTSVNFDMDIVKDGVAYGTVVDVAHLDESGYASQMVEISMPDASRDLFRILTYDNVNFEMSVYLSNVTDGVASLFAEGDAVDGLWEEDYAGSGMVYITQDLGYDIKLEFENGKTLEHGDGDENVKYMGAHISYSPEYNGDCYIGTINFNVAADGIDAALDTLEAYLNENGVELYSNNRQVSEAYGHAELLAENFGDVTEWRGYRLDSIANLELATEDFRDSVKEQESMFESVKNYETVKASYRVDGKADFADAVIDGGVASYSDGVITLDSLSLTAESSVLFEKGVDYVLKLAITQVSEDGGFSSVNSVVLETSNIASVTYSGEEGLSLIASGMCEIPLNFSEGEYVVVAYGATAEEGIRVTEMFPVIFDSAVDGNVDSEFMDIFVKGVEDNLIVDYEVKHSISIKADISRAEYSYGDIRTALIRGALAEGYPLTDAPVQTEDGKALSDDGTYEGGVYRIKFMVLTHGELVEAYIYCSFD